MFNFLILGFYVHSASLNQYLTLILFKWNSYDQFETFPYYFFKVDSLRDFLRLHANEAVSIMFINWLCNDKDPSALLNLFKPAGEVLSMFIATFLACFYSKGKNFIPVLWIALCNSKHRNYLDLHSFNSPLQKVTA